MKDDNDRAREGTLPRDPEDGATPMKKEPGLRRLADTLEEALRRVAARREKRERPVPVPWEDFAAQIGGGYWPGVHVLVAGTGSGKTAWSLQIALHAAKSGIPVGLVTLELDEMQLALRVLADEARVPWAPLYTGSQAGELEMVAAARTAIEPLPIYIEVGSANGWPSSMLEVLIRRMRDAHPEPRGKGSLPMLVVIDFLQLVGDEPGDRRDMRERIGRAAYAARECARRFDVAIVLVSSTSRGAYGLLSASGARDDKSPGIRIEIDPGSETPASGRTPKIRRRVLLRPEVLVGTAKEAGEIEFAADSVTTAIRCEPVLGDRKTPVIFAVAKGRATGAGWCELRFDGFRFHPSPDGGIAVGTRFNDEDAVPKKNAGASSSKSPGFDA